MDITPYPRGRRHRAHDRVLGIMEVSGRVLARRGFVTTNVAARLALAKRNPNSSHTRMGFAAGKVLGC